MGKGPSVPETQTVINKTELPPWLDRGAQDIFRQAQQVGSQLPAPYQGNLVPGFNDFHQQAFDRAQQASGVALPGLAAAQNAALNSAYFQPQQVQAGNFLQGNLQGYMNPFIDNVEQFAMGRLNDQRQISQNQLGDMALQSGGAWGSRHGVREGVMDAEFGRAAGELSSQLRSQAFLQAQQAMQSDMDRALTAGMANQQAGIQGVQANTQGAFLGGNLAEALQRNAMQGAGVLEGIGDRFRELDGARLAQQAMQYEQQRMHELEKLQIPMQAIGAVPYGGTTTTTGPSNFQPSNPLMGMLGGMSTGASIMSSMGGASALGGWGSILPFLGMFAGIPSDERLKTDIKKVGKDEETGLNLYSYRYKGDPKSYPKVVGPMAQEIEKKYPDQVREVGGRKVVNLGFGPIQRAFR